MFFSTQELKVPMKEKREMFYNLLSYTLEPRVVHLGSTKKSSHITSLKDTQIDSFWHKAHQKCHECLPSQCLLFASIKTQLRTDTMRRSFQVKVESPKSGFVFFRTISNVGYDNMNLSHVLNISVPGSLRGYC